MGMDRQDDGRAGVLGQRGPFGPEWGTARTVVVLGVDTLRKAGGRNGQNFAAATGALVLDL